MSAPAAAQAVRVTVPAVAADPGLGIADAPAPTSADGRYVVFSSNTASFVPGDTNAVSDVFVRDTVLGTTRRVSAGAGSAEANGDSYAPVISGDGATIAFLSTASNLATGVSSCAHPNEPVCAQVYVADRASGAVRVVTRAADGTLPNGSSRGVALSANGRVVAFESWATNLVAGDTNGRSDVFVADLESQQLSRVSVNSAGDQAVFEQSSSPFPAYPSLSADGRLVAFSSGASNLVPGDGNRACVVDLIGLVNCPDVFVHDRSTGRTARVSVASDGTEADRGGDWPSISPDGRYVAFLSSARNLGAGEPSPSGPFHAPGRGAALFLHDRVTGVTRPAWRHAPGTVVALSWPSVSAGGDVVAVAVFRFLVSSPSADMANEVRVWDVARGGVRPLSLEAAGTLSSQGAFLPVLSADGRTLSFVTPRALDPGDTNDAGDVYVIDPGDEDRDGMPTGWEQSLGLNGYSSSGMAGPAGDPDADGSSNLEEFRRQSHPNNVAAHTRYFAEGATSAFFETRLSFANPGTQVANVHLRFDRGDGGARSIVVTVPPRQSRKVAVGSIPGMSNGEFATVIETDQPVVAERLMWWSTQQAYGTHADRAIVAPAPRWYFAEGATTDPFDLFYLLQNPGDEPSQVRVRYLRAVGEPLEATYTLGPRSRFNIWVDVEQFDGQALLASAEVSAVIDVVTGGPIIAERAMYRSSAAAARPFDAGHEAAGVTNPATEWFLAEGATGDFFDLFVLVANPGTSPADVEMTYLLPTGATVVRRHAVAPASRFTVWVDQEAAELASTAVSTRIVSLNGVPLVVERAMWWPGTSPTWAEAHASVGSTTTSSRWVVADGVVQDDPAPADTYVLIANLSPLATQVRATLLFDDGGGEESRTFGIAGNSRFNIDVRAEFANARGRGFGVLVESLDAAALVVERSLYSDAGAVRWAAGASALGSPLP